MKSGFGIRESGFGNRQPATGNRAKVGAAVPAARRLAGGDVRVHGPRHCAFDIAHCDRQGFLPSAASRRGQTATEYLMIAGIMTAIGLLVLLWFFQPWRKTVQDVTDCVRTDDCDAVGAK